MPNHSQNLLRITVRDEKMMAEVIQAVANRLAPSGFLSDNYRLDEVKAKPVDFNGLVPMPMPLHMVISPVRLDDPIQAARAKACLERTGHETWYEWSCANWGTKWNAYDQEELVLSEIADNADREDDGTLTISYIFTTAWCPPIGWMNALGEYFPDCRLYMESAVEGAEYLAIFTKEPGEPWVETQGHALYVECERGHIKHFEDDLCAECDWEDEQAAEKAQESS